MNASIVDSSSGPAVLVVSTPLSFPTAGADGATQNARLKTAAKPLAFVGDVMRATFAVMEMHMRKRPHLVVLTELVAPEQTPVAQSKTASTFAQGLSLEESLLARVACRHGTRRVQSRCVSCPDALAEYEADNLCTALTFTGIRRQRSHLPRRWPRARPHGHRRQGSPTDCHPRCRLIAKPNSPNSWRKR
jgi:hypothetical protein